MEARFDWKGYSFSGVLKKDFGSKKLWRVENGSDLFLTTGLPFPDRIISFKRFEDEFIFFNHFKDFEDVVEIGISGVLSHYTLFVPYRTDAFLRPYRVVCPMTYFPKKRLSLIL